MNHVMERLSSLLSARISVLFVGPPGIAKTARSLAVAKEKKHNVLIIRASLSERVDIGGALVP